MERIIEKKIKRKSTINLLAVIVEPGTITPQIGNLFGILFVLHFKNIENLQYSVILVVLLRKIP